MSEGMLEAAQAAQAAAIDARETAGLLAGLLDADVDWEPVTLTLANQGVAIAHPKIELTRSVGIYNPNDVTIYFGLGGATASLAGGAPSLPPRSLLVLPVRVAALEIGIDPADAAILATGDVTVFVMRWALPQSAFLGTVS